MDRNEEKRQLKVDLSLKTTIVERAEADLTDMYEASRKEPEKVARNVATKEEEHVLAMADEIKRTKSATDRLESECHDKTTELTVEAIAMKEAIQAAFNSTSQRDEMSEKVSELLAASVSDKERINVIERECDESRSIRDEFSNKIPSSSIKKLSCRTRRWRTLS